MECDYMVYNSVDRCRHVWLFCCISLSCVPSTTSVQAWINSGRQVVLTPKFYTEVLNICGSSEWNLPHITLLARRISGPLPDLSQLHSVVLQKIVVLIRTAAATSDVTLVLCSFFDARNQVLNPYNKN